MEEIAQATKATYDNFSDREKKELKKLFESMDKNGDGKISLEEFMDSCKKKGWGSIIANRNMFNLIDRNGDGTLQLEEVLTLSYIITSGRPTCDGCGVFISGLFFTCTHCRLNYKAQGRNTYDLCIPCYHGGKFEHDHMEFVDNYMLLLKMQEMLSSGDFQDGTESYSGADKSDGSNSGRKRDRTKRAFRGFAEVMSAALNGQQLFSNLSSTFS